MGFPKYSAFKQQEDLERGHHESNREFYERVEVPVHRHDGMPKTASVHVATLEEWINTLEGIASSDDMRNATSASLDLEDLAVAIRSHLPG